MVEAMRNALSPTSDQLAAPSDNPRLLSRLNRQTLKEPHLRRRQRMSIGCIILLCCAACSPSTTDTSTSTAATASASASATSAPDDPYEKLPKVPNLSVSSQTLTDGAALPRAQMSGTFGVPDGQDQSPQLQWSPGPKGTKSYVVTMYDIDAPTGSGFWHWAVHGLQPPPLRCRQARVTPTRHCFPLERFRSRTTPICPSTWALPLPRATHRIGTTSP